MQLTNTELSTFFEQMAMVVHSGISVIEGIALLRDDAISSQNRDLFDTMYSTMESTGFLYAALEDTKAFPQYALELIQIGETTGNLEEVLHSLATYYAREDYIKKSIKSAVTYPLIMIGMMFVIILVLIIKVLPMFNQVFIQLGSGMTGLSKTLMDIGMLISRYSFIFIIILVLIAAIGLFMALTKPGKSLTRKLSGSFFMTKKMAHQIALSHFASGLALTLGSGLDALQSLSMAQKLISHNKVLAQIEHCKSLMEEKNVDFAQALVESKIFTGLMGRMVLIGYKTGSMDVQMEKIAQSCEDDTDARLNRLISILEPTLVAVLSVIVGLILLSVMLPLLGIMSNIA